MCGKIVDFKYYLWTFKNISCPAALSLLDSRVWTSSWATFKLNKETSKQPAKSIIITILALPPSLIFYLLLCLASLSAQQLPDTPQLPLTPSQILISNAGFQRLGRNERFLFIRYTLWRTEITKMFIVKCLNKHNLLISYRQSFCQSRYLPFFFIMDISV